MQSVLLPLYDAPIGNQQQYQLLSTAITAIAAIPPSAGFNAMQKSKDPDPFSDWLRGLELILSTAYFTKEQCRMVD